MLIVNYCEKDSDIILKNLTNLLNENPNIFIVEIKVKNLKENFKSALKNILLGEIVRPIIVKIQTGSKKNDNFIFYYRDYPFRFADTFINNIMSYNFSVDNSKFEEDHSNTLMNAENNLCDICIKFALGVDKRFLIYSNMNNESELDSSNCDSYCFKALLNLPYNFNFSESFDGFYSSIFRSYIDKIRESTKAAVRTPQKVIKIEFKLDRITRLAWKNQEFQIFEFLIRNDFQFPENFIQSRQNGFSETIKDNKFVQSLETFIVELENFHHNIKNGNLEEVKEFWKKHQHLAFARDLNNKSALKAAVDSNQTEIFAYLRSNGMSFATYQELADYYKPLNNLPDRDSKLLKIFNYNRKYETSISKINYIFKLLEKSKYNYDHHIYTQEYIERILEKVYNDLNETIPDLLATVSSATKIEINFDFLNSDTIDFEPNDYNVGIAYYKYKYINIAAKDLLSEIHDKYNSVLGNIAHEFMHYAMDQVYENKANPYYKNDDNRNQIMINIREKCRLNKSENSIIDDAFDYDSKYVNRELIARVPDMLLAYRQNQTYINDLKEIFSDLFNFYNNDVLPEMQDYIKAIDIREKVKELNSWFDLISQLKDDSEINRKTSNITKIKSFLNDKTEQRIKLFSTFNSKSVILNLYDEFIKSKTIAIFMPISFLKQNNFKSVIFEINGFPLDVIIIIHSEKYVEIADIEYKFNDSTVKKIAVIQ